MENLGLERRRGRKEEESALGRRMEEEKRGDEFREGKA